VQYFDNDLRGRPLLVVTEEVRGNLAKSLPVVIAAIRRVVGDQRFTVIFDRGGYDGQLFTWLVEQGLDFITYQRGEVHLDDHLFMRREVRWDGQRVRFSIAEDAVRVGDSGPWRRVVIRTAGHQRPILTSLDETVIAAARVGALMLTRWRQENFFKYARAHLGLDVLTTYAAETAVDREVPNPAVKATRAQLKRLRTAIQNLRAALGRTVALDAAPTDPARRASLMSELQPLEVQLKQIRGRLRSMPANVRLSTLGPLPQAPQLETKLIADAVRVAAYNAQVWLADRLAHHYLNTNDLYDLLRSFAYLSGTLIRQPDGGLRVCLEPPDLPLHRRALAGLCANLNLAQPVFPGTEVPVHYQVANAKPTARQHENHRGQP
jgi:Transposase protein